jgi:hypothetical protein
MADNLPRSSADVTESGSLNLPEPSGPHRPVMGLLYLYLYQRLIDSSDSSIMNNLNTVLSESSCALIKGVGSDVHET